MNPTGGIHFETTGNELVRCLKPPEGLHTLSADSLEGDSTLLEPCELTFLEIGAPSADTLGVIPLCWGHAS